jgi:hypothetical protein
LLNVPLQLTNKRGLKKSVHIAEFTFEVGETMKRSPRKIVRGLAQQIWGLY